MGGYCGVVSHEDCVYDLFYGTDYHSHLGTRRAGLVVYDVRKGFDRAIHNIEKTNFRPKFESDAAHMVGQMGIGSISDYEPQPLIVRSHHGTYAITTVGKINNGDGLVEDLFDNGMSHFMELSGGEINQTELVATIIDQEDTIVDGIRAVQEKVDGSLSLLLLTPEGIYAARDRLGRTPIIIGRKSDGYIACFESFAFLNLGYTTEKELGPSEIVFMTPDGIETVSPPKEKMRICSFLWIYYGFPATTYEGLNVECVRYECGKKLAERDMKRGDIKPDMVAGVPDSGVAHAVGYSNTSGIPYARPFVKYTPTWSRSFMPTIQSQRNQVASMKLVPIHELIQAQSLLLIDDSIVRGTQLRQTTDYLYKSGAREVHIRPACPPLVFGCKYLNFSRSNSEMELITRRKIAMLEGTPNPSPEVLDKYTDLDSDEYHAMMEEIRKELHFTTLHYHRLDDMVESIDIDPCKLCTYCWNGKE